MVVRVEEECEEHHEDRARRVQSKSNVLRLVEIRREPPRFVRIKSAKDHQHYYIDHADEEVVRINQAL